MSSLSTDDRDLFEASLDLLASAPHRNAEEGVSTSNAPADPLFAACRLVARACGTELRQVRVPAGCRDPLMFIAEASHLRYRRVSLVGNWWCADTDPILAWDKDTGEPVAVIKEGSNRRMIVRPSTRKKSALNRESATSLDIEGVVFYPSLPNRNVAPRDLMNLAVFGGRRDVVRLIILSASTAALGTTTPLATTLLVDFAIPNARRGDILFFVCGLIVCAISMAMLQFAQRLAAIRLESRAELALESALWNRLLSLPATFFRKYSAAELTDRATGMQDIQQELSASTVAAFLAALFSAPSFVLMFIYDVRLAGAACLMLVAAAALTIGLGYTFLRAHRQVAKGRGRLASILFQYVTGIVKLRVAGAETRAFARWACELAAHRQAAMRAGRAGSALRTLAALAPLISTAVLLAAAATWSTGMSAGVFAGFNAAFSSVLGATIGTSMALLSLLRIAPAWERLRPILDTVPESNEGKCEAGELEGRIEFRDVSFRYAEDGPPILKNVNLTIEPGAFVALVGPSGCGKSSLLRLLLGFETPTSGKILIDGRDLQTLDIHSVRRQLGVVLQDAQLTPGDFFSNIAAGRPISEDEAWEAAALAGVADEIEAMPMGMHTVVPEGATSISGGQRQRLIIARALARRPKILVMDEATSALDNVSQSVVSESISKLGITRVAVAHRLSTVVDADKIVVVDRGAVIETGTYAELARGDGLFAGLAARQVE